MLFASTALLALTSPQLRAGSSLTRAPRAALHAQRMMAASDDICVDEICGADTDEATSIAKDVPFYARGSVYAEESRKFRRTVFMHDEWVKHRSSERFLKNFRTIGQSGVSQALQTELAVVTGTSIFCVLINMLLTGYQDFDGVVQAAPLASIGKYLGPISIPGMAFSLAMPALSLLLVFRTNTAYSRWNEARTLWGGVINNCRNVARQANTFFPETPEGNDLRDRIAANTAGYAKALRNFLRGPTDDATLRSELMEMVDADLMTVEQVDACMAASNRAMFQLSAVSANLRAANLDPMDRARIDATTSVLVDLTGACERIFKSPVPLVYTRHTSRFLSAFLIFLPFGLWPTMGSSWNHWATIPAADVIAFFLLGIEEIGIQIEEPFSILPIEAFCNGAIAATMQEMINAKEARAFDFTSPPLDTPPLVVSDMKGVVTPTLASPSPQEELSTAAPVEKTPPPPPAETAKSTVETGEVSVTLAATTPTPPPAEMPTPPEEAEKVPVAAVLSPEPFADDSPAWVKNIRRKNQ